VYIKLFKIEKFYGNIRDIEWGIKDNCIFMLQSRPITNLDNTCTDFEIMHEIDTGLPSEREYISKANVGEVMPGCSSHLSITYTMSLFLPLMYSYNNRTEGLPLNYYCPYALSDFPRVCNHFFFNIKNVNINLVY